MGAREPAVVNMHYVLKGSMEPHEFANVDWTRTDSRSFSF